MADSDEFATVTDDDLAAWVSTQRQLVEAYLQDQHCAHAGVSLEPRWYLSPYLALWAVRSKKNPDLVGYWAISGDVPTDYMTATRELRGTADVLAAFSTQWMTAAKAMLNGNYVGFGNPDNVGELAPLLHNRATMLQELSKNVRAETTDED